MTPLNRSSDDGEQLAMSWSEASFDDDNGSVSNGEGHNANQDESGSRSYQDSSEGTKSDAHSQPNSQHSSKFTEVKAIERMAKTETRNLRTWRLILLAVMLVTGALVSIGANLYLSQQERRESMESFELFKQTVRSASEKQLADFQLAMSIMAEAVTIAESNSPRPFPFVRVPMYEAFGAHARQLSGVEFVAWSPVVEEDERDDWSKFVKAERNWYEESKQLAHTNANTVYDGNSTQMRPFIWQGNRSKDAVVEEAPPSKGRSMYPIWQCSPPPHSLMYVNFDMATELYVPDLLPSLQERRLGSMTACNPSFASLPDTMGGEGFQDDFHSGLLDMEHFDDGDHPHAMFIQPVFADLSNNSSKMVGFLSSIVALDSFFSNLLPEGVSGITAVLSNTCGQFYTYELHGREAELVGAGDQHDLQYTHTGSTFRLKTSSDEDTLAVNGECMYSMTLYYSDDFQCRAGNHIEIISALAVAAVFCLMTAVFCAYDRLVRRRNAKIVDAAARSNAIISSLFPKQVRDRLFAENEAHEPSQGKTKLKMESERLLGHNDDVDESVFKTKPIADLFPETTVLFADIAGFTSWSSVREPCQVFTLLETLFHAFDEIAKKRRIFKVETVGDCYVAVAGLPEARKDHAVAMARFARDCLQRTQILTRKLELTLGPDTADLAMRMGIHSGPVTAGVLRGARSRFQLFGDTMNTAARMESNGQRNRIQVSQETADLLIAAGKMNWLTRREDLIVAKGKGELQTFWLAAAMNGDASSVRDSTSSSLGPDEDENEISALTVHDAKTLRLINWNVDLLLRLLKHIVARRREGTVSLSKDMLALESRFCDSTGSGPIEEVKEIIALPRYTERRSKLEPESLVLDPSVAQQMFEYVSTIATLYRDNPFHNFAHASHVAMSVSKLLSRIVAPSDLDSPDIDGTKNATLHDYTYGITSDPLTQFSCVVSALIHDVDHPGVSNAQLVKENAEMAAAFAGKSAAEQNSVSLAWDLLQDDKYRELRRTIYSTDEELARFRQIVVNAVMATDIVDKDLKMIRNLRWDRAFATEQAPNSRDMINRKATIVIEHLIQASDVAHTMQHWHVYRKWNELFFLECHKAFVEGRADHDPLDGWYDGELGFFDYYIIPLAKKLKDCGVFGVSCDEYLNYALQNRREWEKRGRDVVNEMRELVRPKVACSKSARGLASTSASTKYFI